MPKFLDRPSWYGESGVQYESLGIQSLYGIEYTAPSNITCNGTARRYFTDSSSNSFIFYAPTGGGVPGQVLTSRGPTTAPDWGYMSWYTNEVEIESSDVTVTDNLQELSFGTYKIYNHNLLVQSTTSISNKTRFTMSVMSTTFTTNVISTANLVNLITASGFSQYSNPIPAVGLAYGNIMYGFLISTGRIIAQVLAPTFK